MSGAGFILAINLFVAALFAVAFFLVAANNKSDRVAVWFGLAYFFGIGYYVFEFLLPLQASPKLAGFLAFASFLGAVSSITVGITRRYRMTVEWPLLGAAIAFALGANWFAFDLPRDSVARQLMYQAPYAFMQALCALVIVRSGRRQALDIGLLVLFSASALQFLSKPLIAQLTGGPGASARDYIGTDYALYSQSLGTILAVATGLLMLTVLVRDMLVDVTARSETDLLSGLYNRRGFDDRVEPGLLGTNRGGLQAALIACDLDHFKSVNDTWGHEMGDRVIEAFGKLLRTTAPQRGVAARLGGEEFAIFLPGAPLAAARLYAENLRAAFAALPIPGVPDGTRFTASFGVAESSASESLSDLRRRADNALYAAKKSGRNRVCVAAPTAIDTMPSHPFVAEAPRRNRVERA
jgi:diguanylate cyclase (GGDEF)-like protein